MSDSFDSSRSPDSILATAVRAHFGLTGRQLARYLGVSASFVVQVEAGFKHFSTPLALRLFTLSRLLPAPEEAVALPSPTYDPLLALPAPEVLAPEPAEAVAPTPEPLRRRLRDSRLLLLTLGQRLAQLQERAAALAFRRRGLVQLQAALATLEPADVARYARWLGELADDLAAADPNPAAAAAERQLLAARLAGQRAEVAALLAAGAQL